FTTSSGRSASLQCGQSGAIFCGEVTVLTHAKRGRNRPDPL
ncbi:hypothetical protein, partial [Pseudomonas phage vB_Pae_BR243b]